MNLFSSIFNLALASKNNWVELSNKNIEYANKTMQNKNISNAHASNYSTDLILRIIFLDWKKIII